MAKAALSLLTLRSGGDSCHYEGYLLPLAHYPPPTSKHSCPQEGLTQSTSTTGPGALQWDEPCLIPNIQQALDHTQPVVFCPLGSQAYLFIS